MDEQQLQNIKARRIERGGHTQNIVMVCVTRQRTCERLIEKGGEYARAHGYPLHVVHAVRANENFLGDPQEGEALEYLYTAARLSGGELTVLRADDVEGVLATYAAAHSARAIILGASPVRDGDDFITRIQTRLPQTDVIVV